MKLYSKGVRKRLIKFGVTDVPVEMEDHGRCIISGSPFSGFRAVPLIMAPFPAVVTLV